MFPQILFRKKNRSARLYITACGLYEAKINGERAGDFVFAPGSTDYRKRIQYQTCDVTALIKEGENTLEIELADGWYRGSDGAKGRRNTYGKQTKLIAQLEMTDAAGKTAFVLSDGTWAWSSDGAVRFADLKDGEIVEADKIPSYKGQAKPSGFLRTLRRRITYPLKKWKNFRPRN